MSQFQNVPFRSLRLSAQYLRQAQILILEILEVFTPRALPAGRLWLKFSPSLILSKIEHFEIASPVLKTIENDIKVEIIQDLILYHYHIKKRNSPIRKTVTVHAYSEQKSCTI